MERIAAAIEGQSKGVRVERTSADGQIIKLVARHGRARVKIEVSPVLRGCVREPAMRGVSPAVEAQFGYIEVPVVRLDDLYAGKLCAALDRQHPRDLFDVQLLLEDEGITEGLMEGFVIYLVSSDRSLADMLATSRQPIVETFEEQFRGMALMPVKVKELGRVNTNGHVYEILRTGKSPTHSIATSRRVCRRNAAM